MSTVGFYRAFEERHRGSREVIRARLEVYQPFITPLRQLYEPAPAIDLGCGRGEWLELLRDSGFAPHGVDLDKGMLEACVELGLSVKQRDAVKHLAALKDETQCIVSGFHFAEHIPFEDLDALVTHALRVLKPGGLLILETPNPENLVVGSCSFYLDPTHIRPIPPTLLAFLPEHHGFHRVRLLRLQEDRSLLERNELDLFTVLGGVSPDFAVVAQKAAAPEVLARFDAAFEAPFGIELHQLAGRYDENIKSVALELDQRLTVVEAHSTGMTEAMGRVAALQDQLVDTTSQAARTQAESERLEAELARTASQLEEEAARARDAETRAQELEELAHVADARLSEEALRADVAEAARARDAETTAQELEERAHLADARLAQEVLRAEVAEATQQDLRKKVDELNVHAHHWWQQASQIEAERDALRQSWSWRVTAPLRFIAGLLVHPAASLRNGLNRSLYLTIEVSQRPLALLMAAVLRRPVLSNRINQFLMRSPALHDKLLGLARRQGVMSGPLNFAPKTTSLDAHGDDSLGNLSPRARQIHAELEKAIEKGRKE